MSQVKRRSKLASWRKELGNAAAIDVSERWESAVVANITVDDTPHRGTLEMVTSHYLLCDSSGKVLFSIEVEQVVSIKRYKEVMFPSRTFAEQPKFRTTVELVTQRGMIVRVSMEGVEGVHIGSAMEVLWKHVMGRLDESQSMLCRSYYIADAVYVLAMLPFEFDATLAQQVTKASVVPIGRLVVVRVDDNLQFSIVLRPETLADSARTTSIGAKLDEVVLVKVDDDEMRITMNDGRTFHLGLIPDFAVTTRHFFRIFIAGAVTMVYRTQKSTRIITPFRLEEASKLYDHYCTVDENLDGSISEDEFMTALGPLLAYDRVLPRALYSLFDCFGLKKIRLFEYLHGCRVLLNGDYFDRVRFLFLLFDTKKLGFITYQQFLEGLRVLSAAIDLRVPHGETVESFSYRLFQEIDVNHDNSIQFEEFEWALKQNSGVIDAIRSVSSGGGVSEMTEVSGAKNVTSFGHSQWVQINQILAGIQAAVTNSAAFREGAESKAAYDAKFTYNVSGGLSTSTATSGGSASNRSGPSSPIDSPRGGQASGGTSGGATSLIRSLIGKDEAAVFTDYSPAVFNAIRSRFGVTKDEYLRSLGLSQLKTNLFFGCLTSLFEMSSSGRSGSFFYSSHDNRYILKTIPHAESQTLRRMLPGYYEHIVKFPNTTLTRFFGLHALSRGGSKIIFVVMQNIFLNQLPIRDTYDLKGSTINRSTPQEQRLAGVALKDNDFDRRKLYVSVSDRVLLLKQLRDDSQFLAALNLNDYSFLLGIHVSSDPIDQQNTRRTDSARFSAFQRFYGGIPSTNGKEVYYVGIIDVLTDYGLKKMGEHISKAVLYDSKQVSCVPPNEYQSRFVDFLGSVFVAE
jgi:1-phosphatidylinositol-4-phosphate 5-kinase